MKTLSPDMEELSPATCTNTKSIREEVGCGSQPRDDLQMTLVCLHSHLCVFPH